MTNGVGCGCQQQQQPQHSVERTVRTRQLRDARSHCANISVFPTLTLRSVALCAYVCSNCPARRVMWTNGPVHPHRPRHHQSSRIDWRYQINLRAAKVATPPTHLLSFARRAVIKW